MRYLLWGGWSVIWIVGMKIMSACSMIAAKSFWALIFECAFCCFAACVMLKKKLLFIIGMFYLVASLVFNFHFAGIFCFVMSIALLVITKCTQRREA